MNPLDPLSADEISAAITLLGAEGLIARVVLDEPTKDELRAGNPERRAAITLVPGPGTGL
ncbi:MAG: Copper amine oxidase, domain, partial [Acidimicrobiaceae bacterium]